MTVGKPPVGSSGAPLRILLAEDNLVNQRIARAILERAGHAVTIAADGKAAVAAVATALFDLVLMDMEMPEMSGTDATAAIRSRELLHGGHVAIIALTAHKTDGDRQRCLDAGADGYVPKPIDRNDLFDEIDAVVARSRNPISRRHERIASTWEDLLTLVDGNQPLLRELIELFVQDAPRLLDGIREDLAKGDAPAVGRGAHTLKGSASNFGASRVVAAAKRLEARAQEGDLHTAAQILVSLESELNSLMSTLRAGSEAAVKCAS
jgi:CheY-like chemotaxis protein